MQKRLSQKTYNRVGRGSFFAFGRRDAVCDIY